MNRASSSTRLRAWSLSGDDLAHVCRVLSTDVPRLAHLSLISMDPDTADIGALSAVLPHMPFLQRLRLSYQSIHRAMAKEAAALAVGLPLAPALTHLDLSDSGLGGCDTCPLNALAPPLPRMQGLLVLNLTENYIDELTVPALASALVAALPPSLTELDLSRNRLRDGGAQALAAALRARSASASASASAWLEIGGNPISAPVLSEIGAVHWLVAQYMEVQVGGLKIVLERNGIRDDGARAVAAALPANSVISTFPLD